MDGKEDSSDKGPKCGCVQVNTLMHGLIIILLLFIIWKLVGVERMANDLSGTYIGSGVNNQVFTSGADMRRLGQVFTSTDQGSSDYVSNLDIKAAQRFP
jgi:hypothetical protein